MKQYKSLITGSLIAAMIIVTPIATFADNSNKDKNDNKQNKKVQVERNRDFSFSSFKNRFSNFFRNRDEVKNRVEAGNSLAPTISGLTAPTVLKIGEVGTWSIKASEKNNGALTYSVNWGDVASTSKLAAKSAFVQTSTFTHAYAEKGAYNITFTVTNSEGLSATSKTTVHVAAALSKAPVISNLLATSVKSDKATITWTTDVKSNSSLWYSKTSPIDTTLKANLSKSFKVINHKFELKKLESNTKYYIVVGSTKADERATSTEISFTTPASETDETTPVITKLEGVTTITAGQTASITVKAYDPENGALSYTADWGEASITSRLLSVFKEPVYVQSTTFTHVYNTPGTYTATFTAENANGEKDTSSTKITVNPIVIDATAPVISDIETKINSSSVTISWKTNEPSTSSIYYDTNTSVDANSVNTLKIVDTKLVTEHSMNISSLASSTLYHFILKSADAKDNTVISSEYAFRTN